MPRPRAASPMAWIARLVGLHVVHGLLGGDGGLAQHVVGMPEAQLLAVAGVVERLADGLAGDELLAHQAHGDVDAGADQGLAAAPDQADQRRRQALLAAGRGQPPGQQQAPGRGIHEQRRAVAEMGAPVAAADLVADQRIARVVVGNAQQRLGQAHQRHALLARQRVFVDQPLDAAATASSRAAPRPAGRQRARALRAGRRQARLLDQGRQAFGLGPPPGRRDGCPRGFAAGSTVQKRETGRTCGCPSDEVT